MPDFDRSFKTVARTAGQQLARLAGLKCREWEPIVSELQMAGLSIPDLAERLQAQEERYAHYTPVLRFILLDPRQREFGAERMCYRGSIDGWLELAQTGPVAKLARALIPTLGTDQFYELW